MHSFGFLFFNTINRNQPVLQNPKPPLSKGGFGALPKGELKKMEDFVKN